MSKSMTRAIVSVGGALGAALILAVLLVAGRQSVHATTGVTDPVTGSIKQVAIDMDPTGNDPGTGDGVNLLSPVDPTAANVTLGTTHTIDIIVDEVARPDGFVKGYGFNMHFDRTVINLVAPQMPTAFMCDTCTQLTGSSFVTANSTTGDWRVDVADVNNPPLADHYGEGVLMRVSIRCIGTSPGFSTLTLVDDTHGPAFAPQVFESTRTSGDVDVSAPILDWTGKPGGALTATIYCGEGTPGSTTAPATTAPATTAPATTAPATTAPATTAPATTAPATTAPATTAPATTAPATTAPATTHPATTAPATTAPATTAPATHTPTPTPTATPTVGATGTAAGATTAHASGTPTPAALPKTGGPSSDSSSTTTLLLLLGAALVLTASGSVAFVRARRRE